MLPSSQYNDERYCHSITSFFHSFEKNPLLKTANVHFEWFSHFCLSEYNEYYHFEHVKHMKNHWVINRSLHTIWGIPNVSVIHSLLKMPEFSRVVPSPYSLKKFMWTYLSSWTVAAIETMILWIRMFNPTSCVKC